VRRFASSATKGEAREAQFKLTMLIRFYWYLVYHVKVVRSTVMRVLARCKI